MVGSLRGHCEDGGFWFELHEKPRDDVKHKNDMIWLIAKKLFIQGSV